MDRDAWNRRYAEADHVWSQDANRFVREELADLPPGRALDVAAGEGRNAIWLAERGWTVTAIDYAGVAIDRGRRRAAELGLDRIRWVVADVLDDAPDERAFDLVLIAYVHLPWTSMGKVLRGAVAALAPGGTFFLVGHDRTNLEHGHGGPRSADVLYTAEQIASELDALHVVESGRRDRPVELDDGSTATAIDVLVRAERR